MYPSMLRTSGDCLADFEQLQDRLDELFWRPRRDLEHPRRRPRRRLPALNVGIFERGASRSTPWRPVSIRSRSTSRSKRACSRSPASAPRCRRGRARSATSTPTSASAAAFAASSRCRGRRPGPGRGELSQRRVEDRRAEARSVQAAPDPGDQRGVSRARQSKGERTWPRKPTTPCPSPPARRHLRAPRRRSCRWSTSSRTAPASRFSPISPGVGREDLAIGVDGRSLTIEAPLCTRRGRLAAIGLCRGPRQSFPAQLELSADLDTTCAHRRRPEGRRADAAHSCCERAPAAPDRRSRRSWCCGAAASSPPRRAQVTGAGIEQHQRVVQLPAARPRCFFGRWRRRASGGTAPSRRPRSSPRRRRCVPALTSIRSCQRRARSAASSRP